MSDCAVTIDPSSFLDDPDARQVEFAGEASDDAFRFAVRYDVLEALSGRWPAGEGVAIARHHAEAIATAAGHALARDYDRELVVISENDLT